MVASPPSGAWRRSAAAASLILALALGAAALLLTAAAAAGPWTVLQPIPLPKADHTTVWQLVGNPLAPQSLVAATSDGVWRSDDDGHSWNATSITGLTWSVAFSASGQALYAGTARSGIYRSTDGGQNWKRENTGLHSLDVRAITAGPTAVVLGTQKGVYVSGDGMAWQQAGLGTLSISSVAIVADTPLGVVAGSDQLNQSNNLFSNLAAGTSLGWQALAGGDPAGAPVFSVATGPVVVGGSVPPLLVGSLKGLYSSSDGGATWQVQTLAGGAVWSVNAIAFDPDNPQVIYVGGDNGGSSGGGLERTTNGGSSWAVFKQGLPVTDVTGLEALSTSPLTVLAAVWDPLSRQGATARALDTSAPPPVPLRSVSGTPISVAVSPTPAPTATPGHHHRTVAKPISIPAWAVLGAGLALILLLILALTYLRRRRRRLDAEAPP